MPARNLIAAVAILAAITSQPLQAEPRQLTPDQMRGLAVSSYNARQLQVALDLTAALLARDPQDRLALLLRSRTLRDMGQPRAAIAPARQAWALAKTDREKFTAAMILAQALSSDGQRTMAQLWLRRAGEVAPGDAAKRSAIQGYRYVRSRNPLSFQLSATATPTSNINGGSSETGAGLATFDGDARALSGMEYTLGFAARYLLPPTEKTQTALTFSAYAAQYQFSSSARQQAVRVKASDFAFSTVALGLEQKRILGPVLLSYGMNLGHSWFGGSDLANFAQLQAGLRWKMRPQTELGLSLSTDRQQRLDTASASSNRLALTAVLVQSLASRDQFRLSATVARTRSDNIRVDRRDLGAELGYQLAEPIAGLQLGGQLSFELRTYDSTPFAVGGRNDKKTSATLTATFVQWDYFGFVPTLDVTVSRNRSNVARYTTREAGIPFGVKSAF